jgi:hypothetical protein
MSDQPAHRYRVSRVNRHTMAIGHLTFTVKRLDAPASADGEELSQMSAHESPFAPVLQRLTNGCTVAITRDPKDRGHITNIEIVE